MKEIFDRMDSKKMLMIVGGILLVVLIFFVLNLVGTKMFSKSSYEEVENIMKNAAIQYYKDNEEKLPNQIGNTLKVESSDLVSSDYMKSIDKYIKNDDVSCDGVVNVTNVNGEYRYVPILDCGDDYKTNTLVEVIKENEEIVESGSGLYSLNGEFVFRGENINNYALIGNNDYCIVKINGDNVVLVYNGRIEVMDWDDRYNLEKDTNVGINDYSVSRIREYLQDLYDGNTLFTEEEKLLLASHSVAIGKRKESDTDKTGTLEKSNMLQNQYISLIPLSDYLIASLDSNCTVSNSVSCVNYNYFMDLNLSFWTATASSDVSYQVYKIDNTTGAELANASSSAAVVPVIHLVADAVYVQGDGSADNPYIFK